MQISNDTQAIIYLISAVLFILSLKGLTHPASARRGNILGMAGMALAVVATLLGSEIHQTREKDRQYNDRGNDTPIPELVPYFSAGDDHGFLEISPHLPLPSLWFG